MDFKKGKKGKDKENKKYIKNYIIENQIDNIKNESEK